MIVYWIKREGMTNPLNEGYVGVTSKSIQERFEEHSKNVYKKSHVKKAIDLYDDIIVSELYEGSEEQCLIMEASYRPDENIGWNIAKGGSVPPMMNEQTAKKISNTLKEKGISPYSVNTHSAEAIQKRKDAYKKAGRKWFHNPVTGQKKMFATNLESIPSGWILGRI